MITVYSAWTEDYSGMGLCALMPTECDIKEIAGGTFQLNMAHPMDKTGRWWYLLKYNIIKAPCPVRETPKLNIFGGAAPGEAITRKVYAVRVNSRLRLRTKPSTSTGKIIGRYKNGTEVLRIGSSGEWYEVIVKKGGATGWMHSSYLEYLRDETEVIPNNDAPGKTVEPRETREQLFRIREVQRDDAAQMVYITAWHKSYDVAGWTVKGAYSPEGQPVADVLAEIVNRAKINDEYSFYCTAAGNVTGEFQGRGLISAILENDGIAMQTNARVVRDNFDFFLLVDEVRDKGVQIRHRKNLTGAVMTEDVTNVITRVIPVGKTKNGEPLYLDGTIWVECPNASEIPIVSEKEIQYDVKVGDEGFETTAKAQAELRRLAELEFSENGLHAEIVGLDVNFEILEKTQPTEVVENYAALQSINLYDTVRVITARSGIDAKLRVTGYVYDCILRRYKEIILGTLQELNAGISGFDITGSVSGSKIIANSLNGDRLRDLTLTYAKIAQAAIDQLNADSITALTARINEIVAGSVTTDSLYAALAEIVTLRVKLITADKIETDELYAALANVILLRAEQINAGNIETDKLAAQYAEIVSLLVESINAGNIQTNRLGAVLGEFVTLYAGTAEFDFATIQNLVAKAMSLQQGAMDTVYINNLAVTSANLLSATLGNLVLKGNDGKYYRVFVSADGEIRTEVTNVSSNEINAGQTTTGQQIVETSMNVGSLNAQNIQGASAVINQILTTALTAEKITAAEAMIASATIPALYTATIKAIGDRLDLSANTSIKLMVGNNSQVFRGEAFPSDAKKNDIFVQDSTSYIFQLVDAGAGIPEFALDENGDLYYAYSDDDTEYGMMLDDAGVLYVDSAIPYGGVIDPNGKIAWWTRVKDSDLKAVELKITDSAIVSTVRSSTEYQADHKANQTAASNAFDAAFNAQTAADNAAGIASQAKAAADKNAGDIGGLATRVNAAEQKITADAIVNTVTKSTVYTTDINTVKQSASNAQTAADNANAAASTAQSTANAANAAAGTAQSTANAAKTAAATAQSTADSANAAASKAQTTANSATTAAGNAQTSANNAHTAANNAQTAANNAQNAANNAQNTADAAQENIDEAQASFDQQISVVWSEVNQTAEKFEVELGKKVNSDELRTYMRYEDGTLELGKSGGRYTTRTSDNGFVVLQDGNAMASMEQNTVSAPVINAQRMFAIGDHSIRLGASGHLIIN